MYPLIFLAQKTRLSLLLKKLLLKKLETVAPFFGSVVSLNRSRLIRSKLPAAFKCLYNAASLSRFNFCLSRKADAVSFFVESGIVNDVSFTLLVFGVL